MPDIIKCPQCKGRGYYDALISQHGDDKERVKCSNCNGTGTIRQMTDEEEREYHDNYW